MMKHVTAVVFLVSKNITLKIVGLLAKPCW